MSTQHGGFAWHLHHDVLVEWCDDYQERVDAIIQDKPKSEQDLRLRLFRMVRNVPAEWNKAWAEWDKAKAEWDKVWAEVNKAKAEWNKAKAAEWNKVWAEVDKAWAEWDKAWAKVDKAWAKWNKAWAGDKAALHAIECPDCPWDGRTIFPAAEGRSK